MIRGEAAGYKGDRLSRELLHAVESARTRLAVAVAAENKNTTRERWHQYLETDSRLRKMAREIRRSNHRAAGRRPGWFQALSMLKRPLPPGDKNALGEAQVLCHHLTEVLEVVEAASAGRIRPSHGANLLNSC